jgi:hypothetical protein
MPSPLDNPTRHSINALFRELQRSEYGDNPDYIEYQKVAKQVDDLKEKLLNNRAYKRLKKRRDDLHTKALDRVQKRRIAIFTARRLYLAEGLTPEVKKLIRQLLDK